MIITKDILSQNVPKEMLPTRLDSALNLYCNVSIENKSGIIVYNINPDTWNCLYPFYELNHKFTIDNYTFNKENITYKELIDEYQKAFKNIHELQNGNTKDIRKETLIEAYKKTFNLTDVVINDELSPIYELKYSKSKNVWTLYYFENYVASKIRNINTLLNQNLYEQKILPLNSYIKELDGINLVSNIPYLLSINSNILKLNNNLIDLKNIIDREFVNEWLNKLKKYWFDKDIDNAVSLFKNTSFYQETPFMKPYTTFEEIVKEWQHVKKENIQNIEINLLAIDGYTVIAQWILKQNDVNYDGIYEIKFNDKLECIYFKSWEMTDNEFIH